MEPTITPEELARIRAFIESAAWVFARTTPDDPHEYVIKTDCDPEEFDWLEELVRTRGYSEAFKATWMDRPGRWTYVRIDGYRYWFSNTGRAIPFFINRAKDERGDFPPTLDSAVPAPRGSAA